METLAQRNPADNVPIWALGHRSHSRSAGTRFFFCFELRLPRDRFVGTLFGNVSARFRERNEGVAALCVFVIVVVVGVAVAVVVDVIVVDFVLLTGREVAVWPVVCGRFLFALGCSCSLFMFVGESHS